MYCILYGWLSNMGCKEDICTLHNTKHYLQIMFTMCMCSLVLILCYDVTISLQLKLSWHVLLKLNLIVCILFVVLPNIKTISVFTCKGSIKNYRVTTIKGPKLRSNNSVNSTDIGVWFFV